MNLFPRRSYFLLAISMGPTSLYPDKPSPKNDPFFGTLKKNRSVRTIKMAVVSRRDLSFLILLRRKPFTKKHTFWGGNDGDGDGGGGRISRPSQTPSHHAGISYPVRVQPLTPIIRKNRINIIYLYIPASADRSEGILVNFSLKNRCLKDVA